MSMFGVSACRLELILRLVPAADEGAVGGGTGDTDDPDVIGVCCDSLVLPI